MTTTPSRQPLLQLEGITKRFGATLALNNVHFDLRAGEVHALMGENGAGKSTLMKILAGNVARDSGRILMDGSEIDIRSPHEAVSHGIAIIHQELNTVPAMTVAENLALGREPVTRFGALDRRAMISQAREKLARVGARIDPRRSSASSASACNRWWRSPGPSAKTPESWSSMSQRRPSHAPKPSTFSRSSTNCAPPESGSSTSLTAWRRSGSLPTGSPSSATGHTSAPAKRTRSARPTSYG